MNKQEKFKSDSEKLRQKAELLHTAKLLETGEQFSEIDTLRLVHELQVHQIELELQKEELIAAKEEAEEVSQKYSELYDFAPSGYFTLSREGKIMELNFIGSQMLDNVRADLNKISFDSFVSIDTKPQFNLFLRKIFSSNLKESCEVTLSVKGNFPLYIYLTGISLGNGEKCFMNAIDISERRQADEALLNSEERNRAIILKTAMDGFWLVDMKGRLLEVNETYCQMSGYTMPELLEMRIPELEVVEVAEETDARMKKIILNSHDRFETRHRRKDGSIFDVEISTRFLNFSQGGRFVVFLHDISSRKISERYREMVREILEILNEPGEITDLIHRVLSALKSGTGFSAVGIRMEDGEDFPYISQKGFSSDFMLTENTLIDFSKDGLACRGNDGNVCLACTCGLVISGKNDPSNPFFTPGGSWWTNDSFPLLNIPAEMDVRFQPRNQCIHQGYASVALIPIRNKDKVVGLIQLNDICKERFTLDTIDKLEEIASHIGAAIVRKQSEKKQTESEKRRLAILETAMDGFWLLDIQGRLLEVNETYCRMSGYSAKELRLKYISELEVVEVDVAAHLQMVIDQGDYRFESKHRRKDGSTFDVEISIQYQPTEGGQFVTFLHDITERKVVEENLRQSEERYKSLFQGNHSVMLLLNPDTGKIVDANPAASLYYGWTHSELCKKNILDINTLSRQETHDDMEKAKSEKRNHFYFKHRLANGKIRDVELYSGSIVFDGSTLIYSIIHDITERKQAEEALKENERLLRESQSAAHIGSYFIDLHEKTWKSTSKIYEIFGIDETFPQTLEALARLIHPDSHSIFYEYIEKLKVGKIQFDHEFKIFRFADGVERWMHGLGEIEYDDELNPVRMVGTIQDITRRKHSDEELKHLYGELEDRILERTAELLKTNEALQQTEEKYRTVADFTFDWEYWMNAEGDYNYVSPSCERITGYKAKEFIENPGLIFDIIYPEDLNIFQYRRQMEDAAHDGTQEVQYRIVRFDGEVRWIGHVWQRIYDESGKFIGIRGSNSDITIRKKIEQLLKTSNQKYKLLSENITDGIFICKNGYFEYVNRAMNHIFGYADSQMEGMALTKLAMPDYMEELENILHLDVPVNQLRNVEIEGSRKDQSSIHVEFLFNYVAGEKVIYGVVHDITEKKQIQKNIVKAIIHTEEKERANFSKELHDGLGPLLSTIKLYLQWSGRPKTNKSREEIIHKAEDILEDALVAVKEISNKLSPHLLMYYGLNAAIQSFADKLEETSAIKIVFESNVNRRFSNEIEAALYRAVIECINNTIKHAEAGKISIVLNDTGKNLQLQYTDDGQGFDVAQTLSINKGLGLFNLQNRIQTIGGKINLFSKEGKGVEYQIIVNV